MNNNSLLIPTPLLTTTTIRYFFDLLERDKSTQPLTESEYHELIHHFFFAWNNRLPQVQELLDLRSLILEKSDFIELTNSNQAIDIVGTGGDGYQTFNISTAVMIVCRALGVSVIKHGGKAVTSPSGSSDILTQLGIHHSFENSVRDWNEHQLCFLWAPQYHPIMKLVAPWRAQLKEQTIFNFMGPLLHPAKISLTSKLLGVANASLINTYAQVLKHLHIQGMVVHGGMDELSLHELNHVAYIDPKLDTSDTEDILFETFTAQEVGAKRFDLQEIQVNSKQEAEKMLWNTLQNNHPAGVEIVALNVAAALQSYGFLPMAPQAVRKQNPTQHSWILGINIAKKVIANGIALQTLKKWQSLHETNLK